MARLRRRFPNFRHWYKHPSRVWVSSVGEHLDSRGRMREEASAFLKLFAVLPSPYILVRNSGIKLWISISGFESLGAAELESNTYLINKPARSNLEKYQKGPFWFYGSEAHGTLAWGRVNLHRETVWNDTCAIRFRIALLAAVVCAPDNDTPTTITSVWATSNPRNVQECWLRSYTFFATEALA